MTFGINGSTFYNEQKTKQDIDTEKEIRLDGSEVHRFFKNGKEQKDKTKIVKQRLYSDEEFLKGAEAKIKEMLTPEALKTFHLLKKKKKSLWCEDKTPSTMRILQPWESNKSTYGKNFIIKGGKENSQFYFKLELDKSY